MWPLFIMWNAGLVNVVLPTITVATLFIVAVSLIRYITADTHIPIRDATKQHNWHSVKRLTETCYCSVCESLMMTGEGLYCDCCGVCADRGCIRAADRKFRCKVISCSDKGRWKHHWVKGKWIICLNGEWKAGNKTTYSTLDRDLNVDLPVISSPAYSESNLPLGVTCEVCEEECGSEHGLADFQCCWCQYAVHELCQQKLTEVCDFGSFRNLVIPPSSVTLTKKRSSVRSKLQLQSVTPPDWKNWAPIIVLDYVYRSSKHGDATLTFITRLAFPTIKKHTSSQASTIKKQFPKSSIAILKIQQPIRLKFKANHKSGNNDGERVLSMFRHLLNPAQVVDLADRSPETALEWCSLLGGVKTTVLVAGGDGTLAWVLNAIESLKLEPVPSVAIVPLGTGNDLSRVLGWGKEYTSSIDASEVLQQVCNATCVQLDRWNVDIRPVRPLRFRQVARNLFMYNYISFGVDAQVALDFHRTRQSPFYFFSNRIFNKLLYLGYGTQQAMERGCRGLEERLELYLDDCQVDLPAIESVVVLNIPSWGAGVCLWDMVEGPKPPQSFNDGKLEVVALYSSFHIAQLQMGLSQPHVIGQASRVMIKLKAKTAVQVDGEPWNQHPADIIISLHNQASMLQLSA
uniref:Diacylglycerol kinase n=1 Tax=Timema shepardi TaxID=629360 RepID=A0A7R9API6_TIMSH|nr:unnamed protein product [Timema shepardi]